MRCVDYDGNIIGKASDFAVSALDRIFNYSNYNRIFKI